MTPPQSGNFDKFNLHHLQSIEGKDAWYYCQRLLGMGGNGTAFLVTCSGGKNYGMQFVLKVFHKISDDIRRDAFLKEIAHLRAINHPGVIQIFDEGEYKFPNGNTYPFAVVEYLPDTVRRHLEKGPIDRLEAIRIAFNCLSALNALHTATPALVHRDIKPENILISSVGAKLADFGLVKTLTEFDGADRPDVDPLTGTQWPGMPFRYRTPELVARAIDKKNSITTASDIYQFGTVLHELITGVNPQKAPVKITDPIHLDISKIGGDQGQFIEQLIRDMLKDSPSGRPTAEDCLGRLNIIHMHVCRRYGM